MIKRKHDGLKPWLKLSTVTWSKILLSFSHYWYQKLNNTKFWLQQEETDTRERRSNGCGGRIVLANIQAKHLEDLWLEIVLTNYHTWGNSD